MVTSLTPLRIGSIALDFPVVQAALSGYSDWAMRVIARRLGTPYTLCEVLLDQFLSRRATRARIKVGCAFRMRSIRSAGS